MSTAGEEKTVKSISLFEYCSRINWDNAAVNVDDDGSLVDYVSHITERFVKVATLNEFISMRDRAPRYYISCCKVSKREFIPLGQIPELRKYIAVFEENSSPRGERRKEKCDFMQSQFQSREKLFEGLSELQAKRARKMLEDGDEIPVLLTDEWMKWATCFEDLISKHMWGLQFRILMAKLKLEPVKLLNKLKLHNKVQMDENVEIKVPAKFIVEKKCSAGIHGTTSREFYHWLTYNDQKMHYYADVEVFDDSQIVIHDGTKFKIDRLILRNVRLISEVAQWDDPDFVFRACTSHGRTGSRAAAAASSKVPLEYKLRALRYDTDAYINNVEDINQEPFMAQKCMIARKPELINCMVNPPVELVLDALRVKSDLVLSTNCDYALVYQTRFAFSGSFTIQDMPSQFITENMIKLYLLMDDFDIYNDNIPENIIKAALALPKSFHDWLMIQSPQTMFRLIQYMPNRNELLPTFVAIVALRPQLLKYMKNQPADFQWAVLRATGDGTLLQHLENPSEEMLQFAMDSLPRSLEYLPQPWSNAAIVKFALEQDCSILDRVVSLSKPLILALVIESKGGEEIGWQLSKRLDYKDEKFIHELLTVAPKLLQVFYPKCFQGQYEAFAIEAAISSKSLEALVHGLGKDWEWNYENWPRILQIHPSLMALLPKVTTDRSAITTQKRFEEKFDDLICEQVKLDPTLFHQFHQFFNQNVIARCIATNPQCIGDLANSSHQEQFIAVATNPLNIQYIKYPFDGVVEWAVRQCEDAFNLVQNFGSSEFKSRLSNMLKKRKHSSNGEPVASSDDTKMSRVE